MKRLMYCSLVAIIISLPFAASAGGDVVSSKVVEQKTVYNGGPVIDVFNANEKCEGDLAKCEESLEACHEGKAICEAKVEKYESKKTTTVTKTVHKSKDKNPKTQCVTSKNLNGLYKSSGWDGLEDICGIEAQMDGTCMTMKEAYKGLICLNDQLEKLTERVEELESMDKEKAGYDPVDTSKFVTRPELQTAINNLIAWIESIQQANEERFKEIGERLDGMDEELARLKDKLAELESRLRLIEACIWMDPEYEGFKTDYDGNILPESYKEVCGILGHIPEIEQRLKELEKEFAKHVEKMQPLVDEFEECHDPMLPMWEDPRDFARACPLTRHKMCKVMDRDEALEMVDGEVKRLDAICTDPDAKPSVSHAPGLKLHFFGTFVEDGFNTAFVGGILEWKGLVIKRDGKDLLGFSVFAGALGGVAHGSDAGIAYGARIYLWPGAQDVFGLFLGYEGLSSGIFEPERPMVVPDPDSPGHVIPTGEIDPDRQQHAGVLGISLGHLWPIKEKNGKLHSFGIEGSLAAGLGWQDDALNSGLIGVLSADIGAVYAISW